MAKIEHLVVLMMENRSFDHMFGFLKSISWPIDGLNGNETNPDSQGAAVRVSPDAQHAGDLNPDSPHDFLSVNQQIFGNLGGTGQPTMQGFVKAYEGRTKNVQKSHNVMKCFGPTEQLARLAHVRKQRRLERKQRRRKRRRNGKDQGKVYLWDLFHHVIC